MRHSERNGKITAAALAVTLLFGWSAHPSAGPGTTVPLAGATG